MDFSQGFSFAFHCTVRPTDCDSLFVNFHSTLGS
jgi:hypothetical protein